MDLDKRILEYINKNAVEKAIPSEKILEAFDGEEITLAEVVNILNKLVSKREIGIWRKGAVPLYKAQDSKVPDSLKGVEDEEMVVYDLIRKAGNIGIWVKHIKSKTNIVQTKLTKIYKSLEHKKLIKVVNSVKESKKKIYMCSEFMPDVSLTGGAWYSDNEFDTALVDALSQGCNFYLLQKLIDAEKSKEGPLAVEKLCWATVAEVSAYIKKIGISTVQLPDEDIMSLLNRLVYGGGVIKKMMPDSSFVYRAAKPYLGPPELLSVPCGICPVMQHCSQFGTVNPQNCEYLDDWLRKPILTSCAGKSKITPNLKLVPSLTQSKRPPDSGTRRGHANKR